MTFQIFLYFLFDLVCAAERNVFDLFAGNTDKMVVVASFPAKVVVKPAVRVDDLDDDPAVGEVLQIAVDGREAYFLETLFHSLPYLLGPQIY